MTLLSPNPLDLTCPCKNKAALEKSLGRLVCSGKNCEHQKSENGFRVVEGCPILISTTKCDSICDPDEIGSRIERSSRKLSAIRRFMGAGSRLTEENCKAFVKAASVGVERARLLVIGSGEPGIGTEAIWDSDHIDVFGTDIYITDTVSTICDAHYLPFADGFFDGVWIQAVLEHVVDPQMVAREISRVLKKDGLVYSEIPFMQQVHEGPYDFTRFTLSGHRYLFKDFELVKLGALDGPSAAVLWSLRYWVWSLTRSRNFARGVIFLASFFIKPFVYLESQKSRFDSFSGSFFMGKKSGQTIKHKDLLDLYDGNIL